MKAPVRGTAAVATRARAGPPFAQLATLHTQLILYGKSQGLDLVRKKDMLDLQRKIWSTPWDELPEWRGCG